MVLQSPLQVFRTGKIQSLIYVICNLFIIQDTDASSSTHYLQLIVLIYKLITLL